MVVIQHQKQAEEGIILKSGISSTRQVSGGVGFWALKNMINKK